MTRRLQMDFQPIFMAGRSLYECDASHWEHKVQPTVVARERPTCSICGFVAEEKRALIHADEVWSFPEPPKVILIDVRPLCVYCHEAKDYNEFLSRIELGEAGARTEKIAEHYLKVNKCTRDEFGADLIAALAAKSALEDQYGRNCDVQVDYGPWARYPGWVPIRRDIMNRLKSMFEYRDGEPITIRDMTFSSFPSAMRQIHPLRLELRDATIAELIEEIESERQDDDVLSEQDEGVQWR